MEITEEYLRLNGYRWALNMFIKSNAKPNWTITIRRTENDNSWQLDVFNCPTKNFGVYEGNKAPDSNYQSFRGCVTDIEQIEVAKKLCGITDKINWRERMPFLVKRTKKTFRLFQYFDGKDVFTGYETPDYNTAMAEMRKRNVEFTTKIEE